MNSQREEPSAPPHDYQLRHRVQGGDVYCFLFKGTLKDLRPLRMQVEQFTEEQVRISRNCDEDEKIRLFLWKDAIPVLDRMKELLTDSPEDVPRKMCTMPKQRISDSKQKINDLFLSNAEDSLD